MSSTLVLTCCIQIPERNKENSELIFDKEALLMKQLGMKMMILKKMMMTMEMIGIRRWQEVKCLWIGFEPFSYFFI